MMFIYRLELKKLLSSAAVWGFLAVCLLFNMFIIGHSVDEYADDVGAASEQTGVVLDPSFYEKLLQMTASGDRASQHLERLRRKRTA
jgi:hypothetical protein